MSHARACGVFPGGSKTDMTISAEGVANRAAAADAPRQATSGEDANRPGDDKSNGAAGNHAAHPAEAPAHSGWTVEDSARLYSIERWGQGYFSINDEGHVAVHPDQNRARSIDLKKLVDECRERD